MDDFLNLRERHIDSVRAFTPEAITRLSWDRERVRHEQVRRLRRVLAHAQRHSPFHAARLGRVEAEAFQAQVFPAGRPIPELVGWLNEYQPDRLVGYASIIQELCAEALDGRLKIRPRRVSANSEPAIFGFIR